MPASQTYGAVSPSADAGSYIDGNNGVMRQAIAERFGAAYIDRARRLAVDVQEFEMN